MESFYTKTSAINGLGITELYEEILNHKKFIEENSIKSDKMDERYLKTVKFFITEALNKDFWHSNKKLNERLQKELKLIYQRRLSPYEISKELLNQ